MDNNRKNFLHKVVEFLVKDTIIDYGDNHIDFPFFPMYRLYINDSNLSYFFHKGRYSQYCKDNYGLSHEESLYVWGIYIDMIKEKINNKEIKKIYREIVKLTHPDRVKKKNLNDLYIKATEYYDNNNKIGLYKICTELGIEFQLIDEDENYINQKITELRQKINFIESTFTWKWFNSQNDEEKNQILMNYIKLRIK
jgi:hypothetical protein